MTDPKDTDRADLARTVLLVVPDLLDIQCDPAQPATAQAVDVCLERIAGAAIDWSDQLAGLPASRCPVPEAAVARTSRMALREQLRSGHVPGDRHTLRSAATSLDALRGRLERVRDRMPLLEHSPERSPAPTVLAALAELADALRAHAAMLAQVMLPEDSTETVIADLARRIDLAERDLAERATHILRA